MEKINESPIIVSGLGRSGTTWMQWFLSRHPRIHIHGQSPNIPWPRFWDWYRVLVDQGQWAGEANRRVGYPCAHYAGSDTERCREIFKRMFHAYLTGYGERSARWGLKWIDLAARAKFVRQWEKLWPDIRWVICMRHPFLTINSAKNTFVPDLDQRAYAQRWVQTCRFIDWHGRGRKGDRMAVVQMDKLKGQTGEARRVAMQRVFAVIGEKPCPRTDQFLEKWPIVHKVKPDQKRRFTLSNATKRMLLHEVSELGFYMKRFDYEP